MRPLLVVVTVCLLSCIVGWMASDDFLIAFYVALGVFVLLCATASTLIYLLRKLCELALAWVLGGL